LRTVPDRPALLQLATVFGGFFVGPAAGLLLSATLAPGSGLVQTASVLGFVLVFVGGTLIWAGFGAAGLVVSAFRALAGRGGARRSAAERDQRVAPRGYGAYVLLGAVVGISLGVLCALTTDLSLGTAAASWTFTGLAYGLSLWAAAHHGYLPFLEPD